MVNWQSKKTGDVLLLLNGMALAILLNQVASFYFFRIDLTDEKRFSIKPQTKELLKRIEEPIYIEVFLAGDLNPSFKRFQKSIRETLEEFATYSNNTIRFSFTDPGTALSEKARNEFMQSLIAKGIQPKNVIDNRDGQRSEKIIFPGALVSYQGFEIGVPLLKGNSMAGSEMIINQSIEGIEYELATVIYTLINSDRKEIGFVTGHDELSDTELAGLTNTLQKQYDVSRVTLQNKEHIAQYDMLVIAKPKKMYSEIEKFFIDQYIMQGGKVLFMLDKLDVVMDSVSKENYFAFPYNLNLDDQLFRYGVRINSDLVQDRSSALYPFVTGAVSGKPEIQMVEWPFFPLITNYPQHLITRNIDAVVTKFAGSIDTVKAIHVTKTPFITTSPYSRKLVAPVRVNANEIRKNIKAENFNSGPIVLGYLLEGRFTSLYKNRFAPDSTKNTAILTESHPTRVVVVADGDLARNEINPRNGQPSALGFDPFSNYTFSNEELLLNTIAWMINENGLLIARGKEVKIRPLDKERIRKERLKWQLINLVSPLVVVVLLGLIWGYIRKKIYAGF